MLCFRILPAPSSFNIPGEQIDLKESFAQLQKELLTSLPGLVEPCIEKALNKRLGSETPVEEQKAPESTPVRRYVNITQITAKRLKIELKISKPFLSGYSHIAKNGNVHT
eukprot:sb/3477257/